MTLPGKHLTETLSAHIVAVDMGVVQELRLMAPSGQVSTPDAIVSDDASIPYSSAPILDTSISRNMHLVYHCRSVDHRI